MDLTYPLSMEQIDIIMDVSSSCYQPLQIVCTHPLFVAKLDTNGKLTSGIRWKGSGEEVYFMSYGLSGECPCSVSGSCANSSSGKPVFC